VSATVRLSHGSALVLVLTCVLMLVVLTSVLFIIVLTVVLQAPVKG